MSSVERREQLRQLNSSLISGSLSRQEYDELASFVASPIFQEDTDPSDRAAASMTSDPHSRSRRAVHFVDDVNPTQPIEAPPHYQILVPVMTTFISPGLQLRCPGCGTSNDTARGPRCYVCNSRLTIADELSAAATARSVRVRERSGQRRPNGTANMSPICTLTMSEDGQIVIHDGVFSCVMQDTQVIATAEGSFCHVFVMRCTWQPRQATEDRNEQTQTTWYVSQRFSHFEKLHKTIKKRLARTTTASLPPFPAKYHLIDRLKKRKQGLAIYMPRLLEMCADLFNAQPVPELDEFLNVSHQIWFFLSQRPSLAAASIGSAGLPADNSQRSSALTSSFSAYSGLAMLPAQSIAAPMDEAELAQAEGAVRLLAEAVRNARGDVRGDGTVQHHLDMCVQLAPCLQRSANLDNPFAKAELIPRAMQCEEDLQHAITMYNDSLLAVLGVAPVQQQVQQPELHVQAQQASVRNVVPASAA
ncbi:unnamed protein product [Peronospora destructor]|uniref:PX domain-containing protein n=1 Tax=Peronospora destructor TaxID=86335 RepID=A0AAV0V7F4_9STRA|nr:unnamed protein product [Peronospora destructor]